MGSIVVSHVSAWHVSLTLLIRNALYRALVKPIPLALESCQSRRIRFSGADVELLSIPAGYVGVRHAHRVDAFIDRLSRRNAAQWCERSKTYHYAKGTRWHRWFITPVGGID